jgi:HEAT repeat protein
VSAARPERNASAAELGRIDHVRDVASSEAALAELLRMRTDPSWTVRREVIGALGALGDAAVGPLVASLKEERDDETRIAATADALVASTGDADRGLAALMGSDNPAVLADVAQILGRRRNGSSVLALAELSRHTDDNVATAAIEALGRVGGRAVVGLLIEAVDSRKFFRTFSAIDVLGRSGDPRAIAPLAALLGNAYYCFEAARALGRTNQRAAAKPLARLLTSPTDASVRVAALALSELHQHYRERFGTALPMEEVLRKSTSEAAARRLSQCLNGSDPAEQAAICVVLGALHFEAAVPVLLRALDGASLVAKAAAEALKGMGSDSDNQLLEAARHGSAAQRQALLPIFLRSTGTEVAIRCLSDGDPLVRRLACEALARMGSSAAVPALFELLSDADFAVVQSATSAIQSLGHPETSALAQSLAQSPLPEVRRAALRIVAYLARDEALATVIVATRDSEQRVRDVAIQGLSLFEKPAAVDLLLELAKDPSAQTRATALRALGGCSSDSRVIDCLRPGLEDNDPWVRYYACQSLGKLRAEHDIKSIEALTADMAGQVRVAAIEALSHFPGDVAFAALCRAAESADVDLRRAALIGLGMVGRTESRSILVAAAASEEAATRLVALSALDRFASEDALVAFTRAVGDADENVRTAALGFLGARPGAEATRILVGFLNDPALRERVLHALSSPCEQRVVGLLSMLQNANDEVAVHLTNALAHLGQPDATAALFEAMAFPNAAARRAAATTLAAVGSRDAFSVLQRCSLQDSDPDVRRICSLLLTQ